MKILSVDTSSNICGVAILEDTVLIKEITLDNGLTHSESLMPTIDQSFKETGLNLNDIDLLVVDKGPGSFTGIRIGSATVMAFSDSLGIPSVGVTSLEALAHNVETNGIICSLIDAKNSNCYCGIFKLENDKYTLLKPFIAEHISNIVEYIKDYSSLGITFVGNGAIVNKELLLEAFSNCTFSSNNNLSAYKLGLSGLDSFTSGKPENSMPLYLRKSQAERMLDKKLSNCQKGRVKMTIFLSF